MTASRNLILVALAAVAALALLALFLGVGREGQMRDAEADFQARLRDSKIGGEIGRPVAPPSAAQDSVEAASNEAEMADWYASAGDGATARRSKAQR